MDDLKIFYKKLCMDEREKGRKELALDLLELCEEGDLESIKEILNSILKD